MPKTKTQYICQQCGRVSVRDGLVEAENSMGEEIGEKRLEVVFKENVHENARNLSKIIIDNISTFTGNQLQKDDMTLVIIKKK